MSLPGFDPEQRARKTARRPTQIELSDQHTIDANRNLSV